jgi:hypothetical protein
MKKLFATTAILSLLATNAALADPAIMMGLSVNFGGGGELAPGLTAKVLSSDEQDQAVAAAGVSYFPGAANPLGFDISAGYNFNEGTALIGYDLLHTQFQASAGWVNTQDEEPMPEPSDRRFKRDIRPLAKTQSGLQLYAYRYIWSDSFFVGLMAQDLLAAPQWRDAVVENGNGYYLVNYASLGLRMATLEEWEEQGMASVILTPTAQTSLEYPNRSKSSA